MDVEPFLSTGKTMRIREYLYQETDDACAMCGIRYPNALTVHHINGDSSNNAYDNQLILCHNCHTSHHQGTGPNQPELEERKRHLIGKTLSIYGVNALKLAYRNDSGLIAMPFLLYHIVDLGYLDKNEEQMSYDTIPDVTARFSISTSGKALYEKWLK